MKLFELHESGIDALYSLVTYAATTDEPIELHVNPHGWEFRCGEARLQVFAQKRDDLPNLTDSSASDPAGGDAGTS